MNDIPRMTDAEYERFTGSYSVDGDCWVYTKGRTRGGYGKFKLRGQTLLAHRVAWTAVNGQIPEGMMVCHKCDNPPCGNPDHLFLGSAKENKQDSVSKGRHARGENSAMNLYPELRFLAGDKNPSRRYPERQVRGVRVNTAKLTEDQVREIRRLYAEGKCDTVRLAEIYPITQANISKLIRGVTWAHVK